MIVALLVVLIAVVGAACFLWGQLKALKTMKFQAPTHPSSRDEKFIDEEHAWPEDIRNALASYPPELAEPTRLWILQQRRFRVDWRFIRQRVLSNQQNATENNWEQA